MINFVDLQPSHKKIQKEIKKKFNIIFKHQKFILGPEVQNLEKKLDEYTGSKSICVSSGTDALLLALMALNIKPGDEVITTPFTWGSNSEMIKFLGAKPVYADVQLTTFNIDPNEILKKITKKTKAIMTVNLFGQCCNYREIKKILKGKKIYIIEDAAQSFGAQHFNKMSCNFGDISCTSFFPSKPLGCYGDGGACFTKNKKLYEKLKKLRNHGQKSKNNHIYLGHNARLDSFQGAILLSKLKILDKEISLRNNAAKIYNKLLQNKKQIIQLPFIDANNKSVYAQYTIRVKDRKNLIKKFKQNKVPYAVFYPMPLYKQKAFLDKSYKLNNVERLVKEVISIPFHPYIKKNIQEHIAGLFY